LNVCSMASMAKFVWRR